MRAATADYNNNNHPLRGGAGGNLPSEANEGVQ